jgi:DNA-binding GntR family transcriptional regulator
VVGISRTPVREALLMLAAEDLVQLVPKRGAYVAPLSGKDLRELVELRGMLERFAAEKTLAAGTAPIDRMRDTLQRQEAVAGPVHSHEFVELDTHFHTLLLEAAGNEMLTRTYAGLRDRQVRAGLVALFSVTGRQGSVIAEHRAILDALAAGDLADAVAAIDLHLDTTLRIQLTS